MSHPSDSAVQIAQQVLAATPSDDQHVQVVQEDPNKGIEEIKAISAENLALIPTSSTDNDRPTPAITPASPQNDSRSATVAAASQDEFVRHTEGEHTHDEDFALDEAVENEEPNVDSDGEVPPPLYRPEKPDDDEKERNEGKASHHHTPIPQPSGYPQRILSNAVQILGLGFETGLPHTTPHLTSGFDMKNDVHDVPLPRVSSDIVVHRQQRMNFMKLSKQQMIAYTDNLRSSYRDFPLATVYPDKSDLFSLMEGNWQKGGPQCWVEGMDLCIMFAEKGNLYNARSQFQIHMLLNMPRVRYPQLSAQWEKGEWDFNWERNDNIDSFLAYMCGTMLEKKEWCDGCKQGKGMMVGCVVIKGYMQEACTNHWRNSKQSSCQFYQPRKKDASRKRPRPSSDDGGDDGDDAEEDAEEEVVDLTENVSVTQQSSRQKAPRTPRKKRNTTPLHDFSPINRPSRLSSATLPPRKATTALKKPQKEITPASGQKKGKTGKVQSNVTLRSLEELRQEGLINEGNLAKQMRHARTFTPKQINEQRQLHLSAVQGADNDIGQLESNIHDAEEAMRNARTELQLARERRLKAEKALALVNSLEEGEQEADMTLGDF